MEFTGIKNYPLLDLGLSQIYLNQRKIETIEKWFNPEDLSNFTPLTVHDYGNGRYTLTDGHSRAYVAYKHGLKEVPIIYDNDDIVAGETGLMLYQADITWCSRFRIENISHLENRILSHENYLQLWMERCDRSYDLLTQTTEEQRTQMQTKAPDLFLYGASEDLTELYFENLSGELFVYKNDSLQKE